MLCIFSLSAQCPGGSGGGNNSVGSTGGGGSSVSTAAANSLNAGLSFLNRNAATMPFKDLKSSYAQVKGSPFLNQEPINGTVVTNQGATLENIPLQIDLYSHHVIATDEKGEQIILDGRFYEKVILPFEGDDLVFMKPDPENAEQFFQVLHDDGNIVFFKESNIRLVKGSDNGYASVSPKFSKSKTNYFIKMGDEAVVNVKLKKKDIFSILPDAELIAMKDYAQRKGIKFKDENDFVIAFNSMAK